MKIGFMGSNTQVINIINMLKKKNIECINLNEIIKDKNERRIIKLYKFIKAIKDIDIIYNIYNNFSIYKFFFIAKMFGVKTLNHWIGSDVLDAEKRKKNYIFNNSLVDLNLSCSLHIKKEIENLGVDSKVLPIIPFNIEYKIYKMPDKHRVLVYLPSDKENFYGIDYIKKLSNKYSDIKFYIVGNDKRDLICSENVEFKGNVSYEEMEKIYRKTSILIRMPKHDGLSLMVLEALGKGKEVIYNYSFPGTNLAKNQEQLEEKFEKIVNFPPEINDEGYNYVTENLNHEIISRKLVNIFKGVL